MGLGGFLSRQVGSVKSGAGTFGKGVYNTVTGGSVDAAEAAKKASDLQYQGTQDQIEASKYNLNKQLEASAPFRENQLGALGDLSTQIRNGSFNQPNATYSGDQQFTEQQPTAYNDPGFQFNFKEDPGYKFRLQEAQKGIERSAAANGGLFSGSTLGALAEKSGQMASDEYGSAYGRAREVYTQDRGFGYGQYSDKVNQFNNNRSFVQNQNQNNRTFFSNEQERKRQGLNDRFSRLSTLAGFGTGQADTNSAYTAYGTNVNNAIGSGANAQAAGTIGVGNAKAAGLQNIGQLIAAYAGSV